MSRFRRIEVMDYYTPSFPKISIFSPFEDLDLLLAPKRIPSLDEFETMTDLIQIHQSPRPDLLYLQSLHDRVSALELGFDQLVNEEDKKVKTKKKKNVAGERKKKYTWTAEIKGRNGVEHKYTIEVSSGTEKSVDETKKKKCEKNGKVKKNGVRVVEIQEEPADHGALVLKQAFAKRVEKSKGKRKKLTPHDAATMIQRTFRAYLIRRSQALRALRELAIAKNKLKQLRALFNNFSYRRRISSDAEERQKFTEKIIVLLLTVDAIEGADLMVRAAKKSMVDELEAMLDVVDPQPAGKSLSMRRRTFDMPDGAVNKELAAGVAKVVRMLDEEAAGTE